jgi:hypothetical protein
MHVQTYLCTACTQNEKAVFQACVHSCTYKRTHIHIFTFPGTIRAKEEAAAALRIACDGSEQNSAEMFKCAGISALLQLLATSTRYPMYWLVCAYVFRCLSIPAVLDTSTRDRIPCFVFTSYIYIYIYIHTHIYTYIYIHIYCTYIHIYIYIYYCTHKTCVYICTYTCTLLTHTHTHTHTAFQLAKRALQPWQTHAAISRQTLNSLARRGRKSS